MLLKDKVAIITGGAKGMGQGMAIKFAEEGCAVAIADISIKEAEETAQKLVAQGRREVMAIQCDVTKSQEITAAVNQVVEKYGKIDILVNNAGGILPNYPIEDISEELWDRVYALNLKSAYFFCKSVVPHMKKKRYGKILNLSSIGAINPPAHAIHYNSAKSAVIGFTLDLATALAFYGITVNVLLPGPVRTHFYDHHIGMKTDMEKSAFFEVLGSKVPLRRIGEVEDIANAALFFCSEMSSFITGQTLCVSGGLPLQVLPPPA